MHHLNRLKLSALVASTATALTCLNFNLVAKAASIVNGGFNADLSGWTLVEQTGAAGSWFFTEGGISALGGNPILAPSEGAGYAHSAQTDPTSQVLFQDIALEADTEHLLSFDWFAQDWSDNFIDAGTMDFTGDPNQHFRVDLVSTDFNDWFGPDSSTGVLANILAPVAELSAVTSWNSLDFDLTPWAGESVRLAFRQVDNQFFFNAGIDDVSIASTPISVDPPVVEPPVDDTQSVPEPTAIVGLAMLGTLFLKKSRVASV
ncbi:MAG: hypothetical protein KTR27_10270 [Leptolyngbyaceae cyanobacterium MAG.088]|nr:hypothetical protein [Leptolyngbyaceae cyanobacterium MAG.088]